jgi:hypothetical protein
VNIGVGQGDPLSAYLLKLFNKGLRDRLTAQPLDTKTPYVSASNRTGPAVSLTSLMISQLHLEQFSDFKDALTYMWICVYCNNNYTIHQNILYDVIIIIYSSVYTRVHMDLLAMLGFQGFR